MFLKPQEVIQFLSSHLFLLGRLKIGDFGCGGGYFTTLLAEKIGPAGSVFAVDIQQSVLNEVKELCELLALQNIKFFRADIKKTPFEEKFFDLIFLNQVLFQNEAPEAILEEAGRVLKRKGLLVILEPKQKLPYFPAGSFVQFVSKEQLLKTCLEKKFALLAQREFENNYYLLVLEKNA